MIDCREAPLSTPDRLMRAYYAARAREYDSVYRKPERQADLRAIEQWVPSKFVGARVLEIACGTGYWTQFIAPVALHVTALDAVPETLDIARDRVPERKVEFARAGFVKGAESPACFHAASFHTR